MACLLRLQFWGDFRLNEVCKIVRAVGLLLAVIDCYANSDIDDLLIENEEGIFLGGILGVDAQTGEPSHAPEMAYRSRR